MGNRNPSGKSCLFSIRARADAAGSSANARGAFLVPGTHGRALCPFPWNQQVGGEFLESPPQAKARPTQTPNALKIAALTLLAAPAFAQLRSAEIEFTGVNCAPCLESLPARIQRMRGVEKAEVIAAKGLLKVTFAEENRIRLEQLRDAIEPDGTKTTRARLQARGTVEETPAGQWRLKLPNGSVFVLQRGDAGVPAEQYALKPGPATITGVITNLRAAPMTIEDAEPAEE